MPPSMQFVAARIVRGRVQRIESEGRTFLVVPALAVQPGVYVSIENGREIHHLLPAETISQAVDRWEGMPAALGHPVRNGRFVSARRPDVWESEVVGRLHNPRMDGDRLRVDVWIDLEKAERIGGEAMELVRRVEAGEVTEVSVGFSGPMRPESGIFRGQRYEGVLTDMHPDHLALLPRSEIGQCSVEAGCGLNRVASMSRRFCAGGCPCKGGDLMNEAKLAAIRAAQITAYADISHDEIAELLEKALTQAFGGDNMAFLQVRRYDDAVVYHPALPRQGGEFQGWDTSRYFRRSYTINEETREVTLGDEVEVRREETFVPVRASKQPAADPEHRASITDIARSFAQSILSHFKKGASDMNRDEMITALSKNPACPFDEATLKDFSDEQLAFLSAQHKEEPAKTEPKTEPSAAEPTSAFKELETQLAALTSALGNLDERIEKSIKSVLQADQKAELVATLKKHTEVSEEELSALSIEALERMAKAIVPATYQGRPLPRSYDPKPAERVQYDRSGVVLKRVESKTA